MMMTFEELRKPPYGVDHRKIGRSIGMIRKYVAGMTQKELADRLLVCANYICQIETGRRVPSLKTLSAIAIELRVPVWIILLDAWDRECKELKNQKGG